MKVGDKLQVRLLGPVDVAVDGGSRPVRGLRRKAVLAVMALHRGDVVSTDRLVELVWGDGAPLTALNTLQSHVSHLRHVLGSKAAILSRPPGYVLDLGVEATDVEVAERLIRQGTRSTDITYRMRQMRAALALWRGRPLVDVVGLAWLADQAQRLDRLWLQATQVLIELRLAVGEHAQLLPELEDLIRDHPFDEQIHGQLIRALYRAGRQADALAAYQRLRRTLGDDLGIDPSPALRALEAAILRQDPALDPSPPVVTPPPAAAMAMVPAQLPLALHGFAGRVRQLAALDALLPRTAQAGTGSPPAMIISAVSGTAGVGKTTLAVHWAHRVASEFPDGQLYVNLRGFDPSGSALDPAEVIRGFLDAFGIPAERIPAGLDAQTGLYRTVLAGKRVLVLLDNARDVEQVRPLLPGSPGCLAIVTSRNRLTGLVAIEGARPLSLDLPTSAEARDLLAQRLGADRVANEPDAVDEIVARCARLPLALAIAAARAATHADFPLAVLATELRAAGGALDAFHSEDHAIDVRAVFSWSCHTLSTDAARLFRLVGLHTGPDIAVAAAASLAGVSADEARGMTAELTRAHLLAEHSPGRYTFHDLLRAYAAEQAQTHDSHDARHAAVRRMLDHYLHTAYAAALLLHPPGSPFTLGAPGRGVTLVPPTDTDQAAAWFVAERPALVAAVSHATAAGFDAHVGPLAWTLSVFLDRRGHWHDQITVNDAALAAARRLADRPGQARAHRGLAGARTRLGRYDDALAHLRCALDLLEELGDLGGQARAHLDVAQVHEQQGRYADSLSHDQQALAIFRTAGLPAGQAMALNGIGWCLAMLGHHDLAVDRCREAIVLHRESGDRWALAATLDSLGYAQQHLGDHAMAVQSYHEALDLWRDTGDRFGEADTLTHLGDNHQAAGAPMAADQAWRDALDIFDQLAHPFADRVRAKLRPTVTRRSVPAPAARPPTTLTHATAGTKG